MPQLPGHCSFYRVRCPQYFCTWLEEATEDWRVGEEWLAHVRFAVLGVGNSLYEDHYNAMAHKVIGLELI